MQIEKEIFNKLLATNGLTGELQNMSPVDVNNARNNFNEIVKTGSSVTSWQNVKDFFEKSGADVKANPDGINWEISFETAHKKEKYFNLLTEIYKDGDVEPFERNELKLLQQKLGLSDEVVKNMEKQFKLKNKEPELKKEKEISNRSVKRTREREYGYSR